MCAYLVIMLLLEIIEILLNFIQAKEKKIFAKQLIFSYTPLGYRNKNCSLIKNKSGKYTLLSNVF